MAGFGVHHTVVADFPASNQSELVLAVHGVTFVLITGQGLGLSLSP